MLKQLGTPIQNNRMVGEDIFSKVHAAFDAFKKANFPNGCGNGVESWEPCECKGATCRQEHKGIRNRTFICAMVSVSDQTFKVDVQSWKVGPTLEGITGPTFANKYNMVEVNVYGAVDNENHDRLIFLPYHASRGKEQVIPQNLFPGVKYLWSMNVTNKRLHGGKHAHTALFGACGVAPEGFPEDPKFITGYRNSTRGHLTPMCDALYLPRAVAAAGTSGGTTAVVQNGGDVTSV